jgi:hypothetical protein
MVIFDHLGGEAIAEVEGEEEEGQSAPQHD